MWDDVIWQAKLSIFSWVIVLIVLLEYLLSDIEWPDPPKRL